MLPETVECYIALIDPFAERRALAGASLSAAVGIVVSVGRTRYHDTAIVLVADALSRGLNRLGSADVVATQVHALGLDLILATAVRQALICLFVARVLNFPVLFASDTLSTTRRAQMLQPDA